MSDIDVGAMAEALNDKMDRDAHNAQSPTDIVIARQEPTAGNNYTWYRKYQSGWVEQGGYGTSGTYSSPSTISLVIAMVDSNYCLTLGMKGEGNYTTSVAWRAKNTSNFTVEGGYNGGNAGARSFNWQVSGIAAS